MLRLGGVLKMLGATGIELVTRKIPSAKGLDDDYRLAVYSPDGTHEADCNMMTVKEAASSIINVMRDEKINFVSRSMKFKSRRNSILARRRHGY